MSNLPPGVYGNEDAFGPQAEYDVEADMTYVCEDCPVPSPTVVTRSVWSAGATDEWLCAACGHSNSVDVYEEPETDYGDADWGLDG